MLKAQLALSFTLTMTDEENIRQRMLEIKKARIKRANQEIEQTIINRFDLLLFSVFFVLSVLRLFDPGSRRSLTSWRSPPGPRRRRRKYSSPGTYLATYFREYFLGGMDCTIQKYPSPCKRVLCLIEK